MSHSVVKVTETPINDNLVLIIDKDGHISPDQKTVQDYLGKHPGETEIPFMQVNKTDGKMEVTCGSLHYLSSHDEEGSNNEVDLNEIERNLMSFRMDHDYTPLTCNELTSNTKEIAEIDELAETLSILEGSNLSTTSEDKPETALPKTAKPENKVTKKLINVRAITKRKVKPLEDPNQKFINKTSPKLRNTKQKSLTESEGFDEDDEEDEDDYMMDSEELDDDDDGNESDYEIDQLPKGKPSKKVSRLTKNKLVVEQPANVKKPMKTIRTIKPLLTRHGTEPKLVQPLVKPEKRPEIVTEVKPLPEKKPTPKKEKKIPKPIPDDFALFSTPDIIRRVGGKQESSTPTTPNIPESPKSSKPEKIFYGQINKPTSDRNSVDSKHKRLSVDGKLVPFEPDSVKRVGTSSEMAKKKDRRYSLDVKKATSTVHTYTPVKTGSNVTVQSFDESLGGTSNESMELEPMPSAEDIRAIIQNEDTKTFTTGLIIPDPPEHVGEQPQINLDNTLDLDQSLLDNINSDLIPEDILYQVAQSLVGNAELQNAIDKSLVDGNLVLDESDHQTIAPENSTISPSTLLHQQQNTVESPTSTVKGTPIMRSGGRMVVIPPIERPATRSRNKTKQEVVNVPKVTKTIDDEHVSGGELDSSSDGEKSDDDDPDKLWCICNQPHNNRFMICCDSCEEWYHGKCVNVTKAMGHMMEVKGREWICLYCKDPSLRRPEAAARRIRKASHTSSTDTSIEKKEKPTPVAPVIESSTPVPGCLVCGKPCRSNSIYCSDPCILKHAKVVEKVVVFERSSGTIYTGSSAPTTTNLDKWLQQHPGFEVVRSANANKPVTTKQVTHSKLKTIKTVESTPTTSPLTTHRKGINILRNTIKPVQHQQQQQPLTSSTPANKPITTFRIVSKQVTTPSKTKSIQPPTPLIKPTIPIVTPTKPKPPPVPVKTPTPTTTKEKVVPQKTPKARVEESSSQSSQAENIRDNVKETLFKQLTNRLGLVDDIKLSKEELTKISNEIESQLYKCFGDTGQKYRNKYRSLIFNIKDIKNQTLWRRICEKSINAYQLVRLSPDDLASQELALWRERENKHQLEMITKSELEQLGRNRTYVFKTHKGEQVLEDNRPSDAVDNTEVVMGLKSEDGLSESTSEGKKEGKDKKSSRHSRSDRHDKQNKDRDRSSRRDRKREHRSSSKDKSHHKRSRSKESSRHSDKHRSSSKDRDRYQRSIHKSSRHKKDIQSATEKLDKKSKEILEQLVDNKIVPPLEDRLWKHVQQEDITPAPLAESDSDHEPTSTVTIPTPPRVVTDNEEPENTSSSITEESKLKDDSGDEGNGFMKDVGNHSPSSVDDVGQSPSPPRFKTDYIWKGTINMVDVAQISITAHEVSGDCSGLGEELPLCLDVVGRISPDTVWDYIGKMKCSNSKSISLVRLNATNVEEKMPYIALYSYLSSRNRLGVVKSTNKAVKDFYILPLASQKPLPQCLLPLNGPGFEEARPALLLGIIVRDKRKRPLFVATTPTSKRTKLDPIQSSGLDRSYTPPPSSDSRLKLPSSTKSIKDDANDEDEPYTPEDSDPDTIPSSNEDNSSSNLNAADLSKLLTKPAKTASFLETGVTAQTFEPFTNKFDTIPGLDESAGLPANSQEIQRKMEELDQRIAMQKAEIHNMSQDIASSTTSGIGTSALASIALPQNLQQILDSIKGIHPGAEADALQVSGNKAMPSSDLTIPLILPKISARTQVPSVAPASSTTIPLNLPKSKPKLSPQQLTKKNDEKSVLSSLSEEELIRKAAEMLGETESSSSKPADVKGSPQKPVTTGLFGSTAGLFPPPSFVPPISSKNTHLDLEQPPIPGLD